MADPIICAFDTETTGKLSADHKIIEFYGCHWQGGKKIKDYYTRIHPERTIAADAERVHGISLPMLVGSPVFKLVAGDIWSFMSAADIYAGHNIDDFDLPFLNQEFAAAGMPPLPVKPTIDSMKTGQWATPDGKIPNLGELCFAAGIEYDASKAHAADYDVTVNIEAIQRALDWGYISLPAA